MNDAVDNNYTEISDPVVIVDQGTAVALARAEVDQQVATAHAFPRSIGRAHSDILNYVQLDKESAEECMYALPVDGKAVTGPSIRFAEALQCSWRNCASATRTVEVNRQEQYVEAEAVFWDLETNVRTTFRARRSIRTKGGRTYNERMILVAASAAQSIAKREAILKGIPKAIWRKAYAHVIATIKGDIKTLSERRAIAIAAFAHWGVAAEKVCAYLEVQRIEDIGIDDIPILQAMYQSIRSGEATVEDFFNKGGPVIEGITNPLDDDADPAPKAQPAKEPQKRAPAAKEPDQAPTQRREPERTPSAAAPKTGAQPEPEPAKTAPKARPAPEPDPNWDDEDDGSAEDGDLIDEHAAERRRAAEQRAARAAAERDPQPEIIAAPAPAKRATAPIDDDELDFPGDRPAQTQPKPAPRAEIPQGRGAGEVGPPREDGGPADQKTLDEAYRAGHKAFRDGRPIRSMPAQYADNTETADSYKAGYRKAKEDDANGGL